MITPVVLPWPLHSSLEAATRALFDPGGGCAFRPITCMSTVAQSREHRSVSAR